ncbi:MAG: CPBP family intramembrane metalloprotease [Acidothermus sp.]|nr:CPBP family intramembrane metalloprotease [Acidothermus sp.]
MTASVEPQATAWHVPPPLYLMPNQSAPPPPARLEPPVVLTTLAVIVPIVLGGVYQLVFFDLGHKNYSLNTLSRYVLAGTVAFYAVVGLIVLGWLAHTRRRLVWTRGSASSSALLGLGVGLGAGLLGVVIQSALTGRLDSDHTAVILTSEGDAAHIFTTMLLLAVAAPLVEETLFRGILMEWLRPKGERVAFFLTAVAFAVWHYRLDAWRYYVAMGLALGALYWRKGLVASMTAHAAFNGTLGLVAVMIALAPSAPAHVGNLSFTKPQGWHAVGNANTESPNKAVYAGPSEATITVESLPSAGDGNLTANDLLNLFEDDPESVPADPDITLDTSAAEIVSYPVGDVLRIPLHGSGFAGEIDYVVTASSIDAIVFLDGGSTRAHEGFNALMTSLRASP